MTEDGPDYWQAQESQLEEQYRAGGFQHSTKDMNMGITLNDFAPSKYLQKEDVDGEMMVTIKGLKKQNMAREDAQEPDYKHIIYFQEFEKGMVLNKTNGKRIFAAWPNSDEWGGKRIKLYVDENVEYGGKIVGGLRVSIPKKVAGKSVDEINSEFAAAVKQDEVPF